MNGLGRWSDAGSGMLWVISIETSKRVRIVVDVHHGPPRFVIMSRLFCFPFSRDMRDILFVGGSGILLGLFEGRRRLVGGGRAFHGEGAGRDSDGSGLCGRDIYYRLKAGGGEGREGARRVFTD